MSRKQKEKEIQSKIPCENNNAALVGCVTLGDDVNVENGVAGLAGGKSNTLPSLLDNQQREDKYATYFFGRSKDLEVNESV